MPPPPRYRRRKQLTWRFSFRSSTDLIVQGMFRLTAEKVTGHRQILVIYRRSTLVTPDRMLGGDDTMTGLPAAGDCAAGAAGRGRRPSRPVATLDRAARKRVTIISAPASSRKTCCCTRGPAD
jgi:hypothetical protein